jgi:hypothetical protein
MKTEVFSSLTARLAHFCSIPVPRLVTEKETQTLLEDILSASFQDAEHQADYAKLIEKIQKSCDCSSSIMSDALVAIGVARYNKEAPAEAHWIYQQAIALNPTPTAQSHMAYVCRRHPDKFPVSATDIIDLLMAGVKGRDTFSLVNMALLFGQMLKTESDWRLADRMIKLINRDAPSSQAALNHWFRLADNNDDEGSLVLQWLDRHDKLSQSLTLSQMLSIFNLKMINDQIPRWVFDDKESD